MGVLFGRPDQHSQRLRVLSSRLQGGHRHVEPGGVMIGGDMVRAVGEERPGLGSLHQDA